MIIDEYEVDIKKEANIFGITCKSIQNIDGSMLFNGCG